MHNFSHGTVLIAGVSTSAFCGVRNYSYQLSTQLRRLGFQTAVEWGDFEGAANHRSVQDWTLNVATRARAIHADAVMFNYSVFSLSWRGVPVHVPAVVGKLQSLDIPVITVLHEFAYPWGRRGWRGFLQAASQRLVLPAILGNSATVVATTPERLRWLRSRRWLPRCRSEFVPVFSTVGLSVEPTDDSGSENCVAVFGFGAEQAEIDLVTQAVAHGCDRECYLLLIGQPGQSSQFGELWSEAANVAGCKIEFTGEVEDQGISSALTTAAFLVFPDEAGPTSRRTTLAAALAHGKAVVALDGKETWEELRLSQAVSLVPPIVSSLASEVRRLSSDARYRSALGSRARDFYQCRMSAEVVASQICELLCQLQ